jgi:threonine dehydrogenase-like Zn-dependent dehydrogenase
MFVGHRFEYPYTPGQPGHEATGVIEAVGEGVTEFSPGDRVSAWRDAGHQRAGCYAQFVLLEVANVIKVPANLPLEATASVELAMCVGASFLMLKEMNVISGRRFGVMGLGPAGLIAAQMARAEGAAEVIGFDVSELRCNYGLQSVGLDTALDPRSAQEGRLPKRSQDGALQTGIDCVGAKASVEWLMDHVRDTVALFGVQREPYSFEVRHYSPALRLCGYPGHSRAAAEYAAGLIESGKLDLSPLVTHMLPLERYEEGIELLERQEAVKVMFLPWPPPVQPQS